jgi:hypothetical protein
MRFQQLVADKRVNINFYSSKWNCTPILLLCRFNNSRSLYPCLKSLLARPDIKLGILHNGKNSLMLLCRYYKIEKELLNCIRLLIKRGVDCNKKSNWSCNGSTALFILSKYARPSKYLIDVIRLLIKEESDFEDATKSVEVLQNRGLKCEANILSKVIQSYRLRRSHIPNEVIFVLKSNNRQFSFINNRFLA